MNTTKEERKERALQAMKELGIFEEIEQDRKNKVSNGSGDGIFVHS